MDTVRAVIFDLDDTLYSYEAADEVAFAAVADYAKKRFGLEPERTRELHDQCFARQKRELGDDNAGIHSRIVRFEKFLEELKKPVFPHALNLTDLYWNTFLDHMTPEPGITELLRVLRLRGIQTVVGTNMTAYMQFRKIAKCSFSRSSGGLPGSASISVTMRGATTRALKMQGSPPCGMRQNPACIRRKRRRPSTGSRTTARA